jgi:hypothetical protein
MIPVGEFEDGYDEVQLGVDGESKGIGHRQGNTSIQLSICGVGHFLIDKSSTRR